MNKKKSKVKKEQRVERHVIRKSNAYYDLIKTFCRKSKNLYNHANFIIKQRYFESIDNNESHRYWTRYDELNMLLKADKEYPDYYELPSVHASQQVLRLIDKNYVSYFRAKKDYKKHPEKYLGEPKMPKYLDKKGYYVVVLTNQNCKIDLNTGVLRFPKTFKGFSVKPRFLEDDRFLGFNQVRFIPKKHKIIMELVYTVKDVVKKEDNNRYIGIDLGVNNLITVANNIGKQAFVINGKPIKSINQYYNKKKAYYKSIAKAMNDLGYTNRLYTLDSKRMQKINDYFHKASRKVIDFCITNNINTIIIGKNDGWKQECNLGKRVNQNFIGIPFNRLIEMIEYKAKEKGIVVIITEESYTSGTSFLDREEPIKENYNKKRRIHRGLFKSNTGELINADLNGAYQIIRKVVPIEWNRGCVLHPVIVDIV